MARFSEATWDGPVPNRTVGQMVRPVMGVVMHIEQGSESGTDGWFHNPQSQVSAHFGVSKTGQFQQWVDTEDKAWAISSGNRYWISIENEGMPGDALTESQMTACGKLLAWLHLTDDVPLVKTDDPAQRGLGWHGMGGDDWGHPDCPGSTIVAQRGQVIAIAEQLLASGTAWLKPAGSLTDFATTHPVLQAGSTGTAVAHARSLLGISSSTVFDAAMTVAVRSFQARNALDIDGQIGRDTWSHLHPVLREGSINSDVPELRVALGLKSDAAFDAATDAAVRSRQRTFGLTADGIAGPLTYRTFF